MAHLNDLVGKLLRALKKHKYSVLILLLGIALLLLPLGGKEVSEEKPPAEQSMSDEEYAVNLEQRLGVLLSQIDGAGRVEVMLTLQTGSLTRYQTDRQYSETLSDASTQKTEEQNTVILSEGSAYDKAAVSAVEYPRFQGALLLSEGADSAAVKLDLIRAVAALTGLSSDQITVVKMK